MRKITTTLTIAGALALVPALALAGDDGTGQGAGGAKSKITIETLKNSGASGKVTSKDNKCEKDRRVQFFRIDNGFTSVKIDKTELDNHGNWRVHKNLQDGTYFAKVDSVEGCRYDVSDNKHLR